LDAPTLETIIRNYYRWNIRVWKYRRY